MQKLIFAIYEYLVHVSLEVAKTRSQGSEFTPVVHRFSHDKLRITAEP